MDEQHVKEEPYKCVEEEGTVTSINTADVGNKVVSETASYFKFMQPTPESTDQNLQAFGTCANDEEFAGLRQEYKRMTQSVAEHGGENIKSENCSENHHQQTDIHRITEIHTPEFPPGEVVTSVVIGQTSLDQTYPDESVQRAWITVNPLYGDNQEDTDSLLPGHSIQSEKGSCSCEGNEKSSMPVHQPFATVCQTQSIFSDNIPSIHNPHICDTSGQEVKLSEKPIKLETLTWSENFVSTEDSMFIDTGVAHSRNNSEASEETYLEHSRSNDETSEETYIEHPRNNDETLCDETHLEHSRNQGDNISMATDSTHSMNDENSIHGCMDISAQHSANSDGKLYKRANSQHSNRRKRKKYEDDTSMEEESTYSCPHCAKVFTKKDYILKHLKRVHKENVKYTCTLCPKVFSTFKGMTDHKASHEVEQEIYRCEIENCNREFKNRKSYIIHAKLHDDDRQFLCAHCGNAFTTKVYLKKHIQRVHMGERQYKCPHCDKVYASQDYLNRHLKSHSEDTAYKCYLYQCGKVFSCKNSFENHMRIHAGHRPFKCTECDKSYPNKAQLATHMKYHTGEDTRTCEECGKQFPTKRHFETHKMQHTGVRFECEHCDVKYLHKSDLTKHVKKYHSNEELYSCDLCSKNFISKLELDRHVRIHTGHKPFKCTQCDRTFTTKVYLNKHIRRVHNQQKFSCDLCGKIYASERSLKDHVNTHNEEGENKCLVEGCGRVMVTKLSLENHLRVHADYRPFNCDLCDKSYTTSGPLKVHRRSHFKETHCVCEVCGESFPTKSKYTAHMKRHTGERYQCDYCDTDYRYRSDVLKHMRLKHGSQLSN